MKNQIGDAGELLPFQPLFYCHWKNAYFPPICPHCRQPLRLCRDEHLLKEKGLKGYSETLKRYLFCLNCVTSGETTDFYVPVKETHDPDFVIDQPGLIQNMGRYENNTSDSEAFLPCMTCDQRQPCFGPKALALSRISVFSFFPFYMLIFNADHTSSQDYERLCSGAAFIEPGAITGGEDEGISSVLKRILNRWQAESATPENDPKAQPDQDLAATRIISAKPSSGIHAPDPTGSPDDQALLETIVMSKSGAEQNKGSDQIAQGLEKTRIIRADAADNAFQEDTDEDRLTAKAQEKALEPETGLEKTVIISPGSTKAKGE